jgi:ABC-type sugar transport system ATPase subunit
MENVSKRFGPIPVLKNVSLRVRRGTIHAIVGHNGAGKSTLMKIALGAVRPSEGEVRVAGRKLTYGRPAEARNLGLGMVMQERSLIASLNGLDNLFLNAERLNGAGLVQVSRQREEVYGLLRELGIPSSLLSTAAGDMSTIEQELIEIARALRLGSKVLILDEPTAPLGRDEIARLFQVLRTIAAKGTGIIIITHHLAEVFAISDEVTCLREGEIVLNCATGDTTMNGLIAAMLGRRDWKGSDESGHPPCETAANAAVGLADATPSLSVRGLDVGTKLSSVDFDAFPGEILGIVGLAGSGRTTLLRALFGDLAIEAGDVRVRGRPYRPSSPAAAMAGGVFLIPESRGVHGLMLTKGVGHRSGRGRTVRRQPAEGRARQGADARRGRSAPRRAILRRRHRCDAGNHQERSHDGWQGRHGAVGVLGSARGRPGRRPHHGAS